MKKESEYLRKEKCSHCSNSSTFSVGLVSWIDCAECSVVQIREKLEKKRFKGIDNSNFKLAFSVIFPPRPLINSFGTLGGGEGEVCK